MSYANTNKYKKTNLSTQWSKFPNEALTATHITNKETGETLALDVRWITMLMYMQQREDYFHSSKHKHYFESWDSILVHTLGKTYSNSGAMKRLIRQLKDFGLFTCEINKRGIVSSGKKTPISMEQLRANYTFSNPLADDFDKEESKESRARESDQKIEDGYKKLEQSDDKTQKLNNFPIIKKTRERFKNQPDRLTAFNKLAAKYDREGQQLTPQIINNWVNTLTPKPVQTNTETRKNDQFVFTPSTTTHVDHDMDRWGEDEEAGSETCSEDLMTHEDVATDESDFNSDSVTTSDSDSGITSDDTTSDTTTQLEAALHELSFQPFEKTGELNPLIKGITTDRALIVQTNKALLETVETCDECGSTMDEDGCCSNLDCQCSFLPA